MAELEAILADPVRLRAVISTELESIKQQHAEPRRTRLIHDPGELYVEDLIEDEELVVTFTRAGYIKGRASRRLPGPGTRRPRRPGHQAEGRGPHRPGASHDGALSPAAVLQPRQGLPTQSARGSREGAQRPGNADRQPAAARARQRTSKPSSRPGPSTPTSTCCSPPRRGQVKKTAFSEYDKSRREGFIAINLNEGDELVRVVRTGGRRRSADGEQDTGRRSVLRSPRFVRWVAAPPACGACGYVRATRSSRATSPGRVWTC